MWNSNGVRINFSFYANSMCIDMQWQYSIPLIIIIDTCAQKIYNFNKEITRWKSKGKKVMSYWSMYGSVWVLSAEMVNNK